jgi:hypothetical protein
VAAVDAEYADDGSGPGWRVPMAAGWPVLLS